MKIQIMKSHKSSESLSGTLKRSSFSLIFLFLAPDPEASGHRPSLMKKRGAAQGFCKTGFLRKEFLCQLFLKIKKYLSVY